MFGMFKPRKPQPTLQRDIQLETVTAIISGGRVLPVNRLSNAIYTALLDNRDVTSADLDALANRISRLAWERGRK